MSNKNVCVSATFPVEVSETKSKLAEILGVEEDERWQYEGYLYRIHNGRREVWSGAENEWKPIILEKELTDLINCPENIIKEGFLPDAELEICKTLQAKYLTRDFGCGDDALFVKLWNSKPERQEGGRYVRPCGLIAKVHCDFFPSVVMDSCINVKELIDASGEGE